jgi:hypothetical protein
MHSEMRQFMWARRLSDDDLLSELEKVEAFLSRPFRDEWERYEASLRSAVIQAELDRRTR